MVKVRVLYVSGFCHYGWVSHSVNQKFLKDFTDGKVLEYTVVG